METWRQLQRLEDNRTEIVLCEVLALMRKLGIHKPADRNEKLFDAIKDYME